MDIIEIVKNEALSGVLGIRGTRAIISGEQGLNIRGTGEQRQFGGTGT